MSLYGLDNNIISPPFSAIIGLLLIAGCDFSGQFLLRRFGFQCDSLKQWSRWQAPIIGAMILALILYPLALANLTSRTLMQSIAVFWSVLGMLHLFRGIRICKLYFKGILIVINGRSGKADAWGVIFLLLLIGYFLLALGPATSQDSMDYHIGVAIALLNQGGMPVLPEWFTSRIAGNGEVLNAMGLALGTEQFGSLLQFVGLVGLVGILLFAESDSKEERGESSKIRLFVSFIAVSTPVLLFLVNSSKPQLLPIAMTSLALALLIFPSRRNLPPPDSLLNYALVCMLVMTATQFKLPFMLSGGVIGLLALVLMARQHLLIPALGIGSMLAIIIMGPHVAWTMHYWDAGFIDVLTKPFPGSWPGGDEVGSIVKNTPSVSSPFFIFPLSIIIPSGMPTAAHVLGFGVLLLFTVRPKRDLWMWMVLIAICFVIIGIFLLGPPAARYYLEPFFWCLLLLAIYPTSSFLLVNSWFRWAILVQSICVFIVMAYGVLTLFPGALTSKWREQVMHRSANGYSVMQWVDTVLPKDAVLLNRHRSMALAPRDAVSTVWMNFMPIDTEAYLNRIKERGVTHILVLSPDSPFSSCFGKLVAESEIDHYASRNPYFWGGSNNARIFEFRSELLPECVVNSVNPR